MVVDGEELKSSQIKHAGTLDSRSSERNGYSVLLFSSKGISKAGIFNPRCKYVGKDASIWYESCDDEIQ